MKSPEEYTSLNERAVASARAESKRRVAVAKAVIRAALRSSQATPGERVRALIEVLAGMVKS